MITVTQVPCLDKSEDPRKFSLNFPQETNLTIEDGAEYRLWGGEAPENFWKYEISSNFAPRNEFYNKGRFRLSEGKAPENL